MHVCPRQPCAARERGQRSHRTFFTPTRAQPKAQAAAVAKSERQAAEIYAFWLKEDAALTEEERELVCGDQHSTIGSILLAAAAY